MDDEYNYDAKTNKNDDSDCKYNNEKDINMQKNRN